MQNEEIAVLCELISSIKKDFQTRPNFSQLWEINPKELMDVLYTVVSLQ